MPQMPPRPPGPLLARCSALSSGIKKQASRAQCVFLRVLERLEGKEGAVPSSGT